MVLRDYLGEIDIKAEELTKLSDEIWEKAETAFSEQESVRLLTDFLRKEGFEVNCPAYGIETAFTASYGSTGPVIALLGEYDALAGLSQKSDCFEKEAVLPGGNGHGCGHNLLGVGSLAAALAVKKYLEKHPDKGTIIYYGCPGEEGGSGKAFMAREGAFDHVDCALCWHPAETNHVIQYTSLANAQILYHFTGRSAHAAENPEDGRSALDALELMNVGVNFLREHMISQARIHYAIVDSGGYSPNVVQSSAKVLYLIRAPKMSQVLDLVDRVEKIAKGMAIATETEVTSELIKTCSNLVPNHVLEQKLSDSMQVIPVPEFTENEYEYSRKMTATSSMTSPVVLEKWTQLLNQEENIKLVTDAFDRPLYDFVIPYEKMVHAPDMGGSTDVGDVSWHCPTGQIETATWAPNSGGHSWQIVAQGKGSIAHKSMLYCGKVLGLTAMQLMNEPDTIKAAKEELHQRIKNESYVPIPKGIRPRKMNSF